MDKSWVIAKNKERDARFLELYQNIRNILISSNIFTDDEVEEVIRHAREMLRMGFTSQVFMMPHEIFNKRKELYGENKDALFEFHDKAYHIFDNIDFTELCELERTSYEYYQDSEPMEFDGDIIITDPCYIMRDDQEPIDYSTSPNWWDYVTRTRDEIKDGKTFKRPPLHSDYPDCVNEESPTLKAEWDAYHSAYEKWRNEQPISDWEKSEYGDRLDILGINHFMTRNTIYGDWSCSTYNTDTRKKIGSFCADAGLVSVILLDEVLKYNPSYNDHTEKKWTTTWIKDFKGTVQFVVKEVRWTLDHDTSYGKKGDEHVDYNVEVVGHGVNKKTNKPINFVGKQTGF